MTYENFKQEIEKLGLNVFALNYIVYVNNDKYKPIYYVGIKKRYDLYPSNGFYNLDESLQHKVFELVNELAKTPLDERGVVWNYLSMKTNK